MSDTKSAAKKRRQLSRYVQVADRARQALMKIYSEYASDIDEVSGVAHSPPASTTPAVATQPVDPTPQPPQRKKAKISATTATTATTTAVAAPKKQQAVEVVQPARTVKKPVTVKQQQQPPTSSGVKQVDVSESDEDDDDDDDDDGGDDGEGGEDPEAAFWQRELNGEDDYAEDYDDGDPTVGDVAPYAEHYAHSGPPRRGRGAAQGVRHPPTRPARPGATVASRGYELFDPSAPMYPGSI